MMKMTDCDADGFYLRSQDASRAVQS